MNLHLFKKVVMLLDGYYHLCQAILCTVRIVSRRIQFTYTSRHTYGLARVGVVGELVAFISFLSLSVSVFLESVKHLIDVVFILPQRENNSTALFTAHGHEHIHSIIDHPKFILGVGLYATISNCLLGVAILYKVIKRARKLKQQLKHSKQHLQHPLPKKLFSKSLLISDTLSTHHSFLQVLNMLLGPLAILACGILLIMLSEAYHVRVIYTRLVDPIIGCFLFLSYFLMICVPIREVIHLVLQAKPNGLKSDEIESAIIESIPGVTKIHEFHVWRLTPQKTLATIHIVFNTTNDIISKYQNICLIFKAHHIDHVTIQPEFSLRPDEIKKLTNEQQSSVKNNECSTIQCSEKTTIEEIDDEDEISSIPRQHFHRRSSISLNSIESENETIDETECLSPSQSPENSFLQPSPTKLTITKTYSNKEKFMLIFNGYNLQFLNFNRKKTINVGDVQTEVVM
ncbi:unnamed protein product [Rotaria magnacalcarata]